MNEFENIVVGVAWYRPEQWSLLRAVAADAEILENTHTEWLAVATKTFNDLSKEGAPLQKVDVDVRELVAWCEQKGRPVDQEARAAYASEKVREDDLRI